MTQDTLTESSASVEPRTAVTVTSTANAPLAPFTHIRRFNHSGGVQDFTVPAGVTTVNARCWGGGGAGGNGGGGGFVSGDIAVKPGEILKVVVDLGGGPTGGGGMSGLYSQRLGATLLIAGGGGGAGGDVARARGGEGGGTNGSNGMTDRKGSWTGDRAYGASGSTGGAPASTHNNFGGRGGDTGSNGAPTSTGSPHSQLPIPGMGGGGGAGKGGDTGGGAGYAGGGGGIALGHAPGSWYSGGGGGSSYTGGPGVTAGRTAAGSGTRAGGQSDALYQPGVGEAGRRGQVVLQWTEFTLTPGGPPDVELIQGGTVGYPGVRVEAEVAFAPVSVIVTLPAGRGLLFGTQTLADYQLSVQPAGGPAVPYTGQLSQDGTSLLFSDVDLKLPGTTIMWVAVSAGHDATPGATNLAFNVGGKTASSTTVVVQPSFTVSSSGDPVQTQPGGTAFYPGVRVRNTGTQNLPLQEVTVALPEGLRFGTSGSPDHQVTVMSAGGAQAYMGSVSADGQTLTFTDIDLDIPDDGAEAILYVCVSAADDAPAGDTSLEFTIGTQTSPSAPIHIN
ncbi:hypothetical protein B6E66_13360 [Streptomyces maremycinicus]|nr:hypothetical protein B6E66_13360 [Streptomyces sp. B9173]